MRTKATESQPRSTCHKLGTEKAAVGLKLCKFPFCVLRCPPAAAQPPWCTCRCATELIDDWEDGWTVLPLPSGIEIGDSEISTADSPLLDRQWDEGCALVTLGSHRGKTLGLTTKVTLWVRSIRGGGRSTCGLFLQCTVVLHTPGWRVQSIT